MLPRELPPAPAGLMQPVPMPRLRLGVDARIPLAQTRDALRIANDRLSNSAQWYDGVRTTYGSAAR